MRSFCQTMLLVALFLSIPAATIALRDGPAPTQSKEWTDYHDHDPGMTLGSSPSPGVAVDSVASDLQKVVVLCAKDPYSRSFDEAWKRYLQRHYKPGVDVDAVINDVLRRARRIPPEEQKRTYQMSRQNRGDENQIRSRMKRVAKKTLSR